MKSDKLFQNSALVSAFLASLCCITPVLAVLGGLSGIASTFSFLDPLRPYFIGFTAIVLGYAFYNAYKPKKETEIECACLPAGALAEAGETEPERKKSFINSKAFLWLVTLIAVVLISFPYYSQFLFLNSQNTVVANADNIVKVKLDIEGMTCTSCEESVNYALKEETGVISATSSYKTGIAYVEYDSTKVDSGKLKQAVEEKVGYKVKSLTVE